MGDCEDGRWKGIGKNFIDDGRIYTGEFQNNKRRKGEMSYLEGDIRLIYRETYSNFEEVDEKELLRKDENFIRDQKKATRHHSKKKAGFGSTCGIQ